MKKGFTLIEMLVAVFILALISMLVIPTIVNKIAEQKENLNSTTLNMIYSAATLYFDDYEVVKEKGTSYCVTLDRLVKENYLTSPITDTSTGKEIPLTKYVKTTINSTLNYDKFELTDESC